MDHDLTMSSCEAKDLTLSRRGMTENLTLSSFSEGREADALWLQRKGDPGEDSPGSPSSCARQDYLRFAPVNLP